MSPDIAYRSTDPVALEAWEDIERDYRAWADRVQDWLARRGMQGRHVRILTNPISGARSVVGIDDTAVPEGWRAHRDGYIVPDKRTATGRADAELMASLVSPLIAAWGAHAKPDRVAAVLALPGMGALQALGVTKAGAPRHPLYMPTSAVPAPWPVTP